MRSRFTAFALGDAVHLRETWSPRTRPEDTAPDPDTVWTRLEVLEASAEGDAGTVRFRAHWRDRPSGQSGVVAEHSRFVRRAGRWWYVEAL